MTSSSSLFSWSEFKKLALSSGSKLPFAMWGEKNGKRELIHAETYKDERQIIDAIAELSFCFNCFDSVFWCYVDANYKFHSSNSNN